MSETMNAGGALTLEPKSHTATPATVTSPFNGTYTKQNQSGVDWDFVVITTDSATPELIINLNGVDHWGTAEMLLDLSLPIAQFANSNGLEFLYATICDSNLLTITYLNYITPPESPITGVWLGTTSGGPFCPTVEA